MMLRKVKNLMLVTYKFFARESFLAVFTKAVLFLRWYNGGFWGCYGGCDLVPVILLGGCARWRGCRIVLFLMSVLVAMLAMLMFVFEFVIYILFQHF